MNISKQVNVMLALLFLVVVSLGLYFVWDINIRESDASERQVAKNAERGAFLFARNCRVCHGAEGRGTLENPNLPGVPLNLEGSRPIDPSTGLGDEAGISEIQARFTDTMVCGRVGTLMPPWHQDQGGPLNDLQIEQLVTLITGATSNIVPADPNAISEVAWEEAVEFAEEGDIIDKHLQQAVSADDTVLTLNDALGLAPETFLRIEDEVLGVVTVPASSELDAPVQESDSVVVVRDGSGFEPGVVIGVNRERMRIVSVSDSEISVDRAIDGTEADFHLPRSSISDTSTDITVERGVFSTEAAEHEAEEEVFAGPIMPPEEPLTSATCGQLAVPPPAEEEGAPASIPSPGQPEQPGSAQAVTGDPEPVTGAVLEVEADDNFFVTNNFQVAAGQEITISVTNIGQTPHNLRVAGLDGEWSTDDDVAAPADGSFPQGGESGEGSFVLGKEATLVFRCDVHPTQMWGQITVVAE